MIPPVVAVAGAAAISMYLDAKYHLSKDITALAKTRRVEAARRSAINQKRVSLYNFFADAVARRGDAECLWSRAGCYSWNETRDHVHRYANFFLLRGVRPGDLVAIYLMNSPDFMFAWLGLWCIGASPAMINYNLAGKPLVHCLGVSKAKILLVDADMELMSRVNEARDDIQGLGMEIVMLKDKLKEMRNEDSSMPDKELYQVVEGSWPMCLFYTSGTTGLPKAVSYTHERGFERGFYALANDEDRWYVCMPLFHGTGGVSAMSRMMRGTALCIGVKFSTSGFWQDIRDSRATWFTYVGETARYLLNTPPSPLDRQHNLRGMFGNGLRPDVWRKFQDRFGVSEVLEFFNSSEGVFSLMIHAKGEFFEGCVGHHGGILRAKYQDIFVPVQIDPDTAAVIRDKETGLAIRESYEKGGEILTRVSAESEFAGYYGNPEATSKKFERNVFEKGDLWYRSGDALRRDDDGRWFFLDRLGDTYRWKGENVSTAEVGEAVGRFEDIVEANVYGVEVPGHDGRAGCAAIFVEETKRGKFDFEGLLRHVRSSLPRYAVPIFIRMVTEMRPIHNNKQNKVPLRAEGVDPNRVEPRDRIYFVPSGGSRYIPFERKQWEALVGGRSKL